MRLFCVLKVQVKFIKIMKCDDDSRIDKGSLGMDLIEDFIEFYGPVFNIYSDSPKNNLIFF